MAERETGKPRGFGFVEFFDTPTAESAIRNLSGKDFKGRPIRCGPLAPRWCLRCACLLLLLPPLLLPPLLLPPLLLPLLGCAVMLCLAAAASAAAAG